MPYLEDDKGGAFVNALRKHFPQIRKVSIGYQSAPNYYTFTFDMYPPLHLQKLHHSVDAYMLQMNDQYALDHVVYEMKHVIKEQLYKLYFEASEAAVKIELETLKNQEEHIKSLMSQAKDPLLTPDMLESAMNKLKTQAEFKHKHPIFGGFDPGSVVTGTNYLAQQQLHSDSIKYMVSGVIGGSFKSPGSNPVATGILGKLSKHIPGLQEKTKCPARNDSNTSPTVVSCNWGESEGTVANVIMHLNDHHHQTWSREKIADWLETLDIDLQFKGVEK